MTMREVARAVVVAAGLVVVATVASCSAPEHWAARLAPDGTVDFLDCDEDLWQIRVDYLLEDEPLGAPHEWDAQVGFEATDEDRNPVEVAFYGRLPDGWVESVPAVMPPADWVSVSTTAGYATRGELVEGEWVWFIPRMWPWTPEGQCEGWELGADGEPRRIPS